MIVEEEVLEGSSEGLIQENETIDVIMKSRVFKNLFEALEFGEEAQKEATLAIVDLSKKYKE